MISVPHCRWLSQWFFGFLAILSLAALLGCQPTAGTNSPRKEPASNDSPTSNSADKTADKEPLAPGEVKESPSQTPESGLPGVEGPVQKMPDPTPSKEEPRDQGGPPIKQVSYEVPVKEEKSPAGVSGSTLEVTVKWLPKPADNPAAEASNQAGMKPYSEKLESEVKLDLAPIPGGTFTMGSPGDEKGRAADEGPQVKVKLEPFWMGKHEITWAQYELWAMGLDKDRRKAKQTAPTGWDKAADALAIPTKPYADMTFGMGKEGYPAVCMTQFAAKLYCKWLSAKTGHYYRLPTEAEWEYACRAGTTGAYSFGNDPEKLGDYAWSVDNSDEKYHKVGKKKPNAWGLYDMHGNVAEWCVDQYVADRYKQLGDKLVESPFIAVTKGYPQMVRGGSWVDEAPLLRSAARRGSSKDWKTQDPQLPQSIWYFTDASFVGFRVVRPLRVPTPEEAARYEITDYEKRQFLDYRKAQAGKQ
jgi:formylglycine-generating enzyme required for sulfatase activity